MIKWTRLHGRYFCRHVQSPRKDVVNYKTFWFFEINWDREQFREGFAPPQSHNTPFARRTAARADQFRRRREGPEEPETRSWLYDLGRGLRRDAGRFDATPSVDDARAVAGRPQFRLAIPAGRSGRRHVSTSRFVESPPVFREPPRGFRAKISASPCARCSPRSQKNGRF